MLAITWSGAAGALAWCLLGPDDTAGRLLIGVTAAALAAAAAYGTRARPRLAADRRGIQVGGLRGSHQYPWSSVHSHLVVHTRRFGRDVATLEIETAESDTGETSTRETNTSSPPDGGNTERLHVFSRLELGADPAEVAEHLDALRSRSADQ
ncbi:MAG: PH domain-containing protein [Actinomycetota bacterium]|nr:PH domain-containing protein [Actinomycetota bacterium]